MRASTRLRRSAIALIAVAALALTACTGDSGEPVDHEPIELESTLPDALVTELQEAVTVAMAASDSSAAVVGVWAPWSGQWVSTLGSPTVEGGAAVSVDALFRASNVTRPMTCDVLYALADEGTVSLDDSPVDYLSGVADTHDMTLAQLCDSSSGMGMYAAQIGQLWYTVPNREWMARELVGYGMGQPRTTAPGEVYRNSDASYVLLGLVLERAAGKPLPELFEEYVFEPLGLNHTFLPESGAEVIPGLLEGYETRRDAEGVMQCGAADPMTSMVASFGYGSAGVVTDVIDLGAYVKALASGATTIGDVARFDNPFPMSASAPAWYTTKGGAIQYGPLVGQYGSVPGYSTAAFSDPESGLTVVAVLNNTSMGSASVYLAWELAAIASKAAPAAGQTLPEAGLPWTAEQQRESITSRVACALPVAEAEEG